MNDNGYSSRGLARERSETSALHEAAHALVGHLLGWQVRWIRLYGDRESRRTGFDGGTLMLPPRQAPLVHRAAVRLAGEAVEALCTDRDAPQILSDGEDDRQQLLEVDLSRCHLSGRRKNEVADLGRELSRKLIAWNWDKLLDLADAVQRGRVSAATAGRIIGDGCGVTSACSAIGVSAARPYYRRRRRR
jgi:hypothetical protein